MGNASSFRHYQWAKQVQAPSPAAFSPWQRHHHATTHGSGQSCDASADLPAALQGQPQPVLGGAPLEEPPDALLRDAQPRQPAGVAVDHILVGAPVLASVARLRPVCHIDVEGLHLHAVSGGVRRQLSAPTSLGIQVILQNPQAAESNALRVGHFSAHYSTGL